MPQHDLTDEQWSAVQHLFPPPPSAACRGRPPIDERAVLDGVLWKLRNAAPWYDMPARYPSHQTCYRRYRLWRNTGRLDQILRALERHLHQRGGLDIHRAFEDGDLALVRQQGRWTLRVAPHLQDTWQLTTALLLLRVALNDARRRTACE